MINAILGAEAVCIFASIVVIFTNYGTWGNRPLRAKYSVLVTAIMLVGIIADLISYIIGYDYGAFPYALASAISYTTEYFTTAFYIYFINVLTDETLEGRVPMLRGILAFNSIMAAVMFFFVFTFYYSPFNSLGITENLIFMVYPVFETILFLILIVSIICNRRNIEKKYRGVSWSLVIGLVLSVFTTFINESADFSFVYASMSMLVVHLYVQVDEARKREEALNRLSYTDGLTGLYNRNAYALHISDIKITGSNSNLYYMSVDLDELKKTNDTYGHGAGDSLICGAGNILTEAVGTYGNVYRMGGDEFAVIVHAGKPEMTAIENKIHKLMSEWRDEYNSGIHYSMGLVCADEIANASVDALEKEADTRMYAEKKRHHEETGYTRQ